MKDPSELFPAFRLLEQENETMLQKKDHHLPLEKVTLAISWFAFVGALLLLGRIIPMLLLPTWLLLHFSKGWDLVFSKFRKPLIEDKGSTVGFWLLFAAFVYLYGRVFHFVFD